MIVLNIGFMCGEQFNVLLVQFELHVPQEGMFYIPNYWFQVFRILSIGVFYTQEVLATLGFEA